MQDESARNDGRRAEEADHCLKLAIIYYVLLCHFIDSVALISTVSYSTPSLDKSFSSSVVFLC